jgi:hypothetical protein
LYGRPRASRKRAPIAEYVENHEVRAAQLLGQLASPAFGLQAIDHINNLEGQTSGAVPGLFG